LDSIYKYAQTCSHERCKVIVIYIYIYIYTSADIYIYRGANKGNVHQVAKILKTYTSTDIYIYRGANKGNVHQVAKILKTYTSTILHLAANRQQQSRDNQVDNKITKSNSLIISLKSMPKIA